jgi:hypothetical protein
LKVADAYAATLKRAGAKQYRQLIWIMVGYKTLCFSKRSALSSGVDHERGAPHRIDAQGTDLIGKKGWSTPLGAALGWGRDPEKRFEART